MVYHDRSPADRGEGRADLIVGDEALEGVVRHGGQLELVPPGDVCRLAWHPLDVGPPLGAGEHVVEAVGRPYLTVPDVDLIVERGNVGVGEGRGHPGSIPRRP